MTCNEAVLLLCYKCPYQQEALYRTLSNWLGCNSYILPDDRVLNESALHLQPRDRADILHIYHFTCLLEVHATTEEQTNILRELLCYPNRYMTAQHKATQKRKYQSTQESRIFPIPPYSLYTPARANSN